MYSLEFISAEMREKWKEGGLASGRDNQTRAAHWRNGLAKEQSWWRVPSKLKLGCWFALKNLRADNKLRFFHNETKFFFLFKEEKYFFRTRFFVVKLVWAHQKLPQPSGITLVLICFSQSNKVSGELGRNKIGKTRSGLSQWLNLGCVYPHEAAANPAPCMVSRRHL